MQAADRAHPHGAAVCSRRSPRRLSAAAWRRAGSLAIRVAAAHRPGSGAAATASPANPGQRVISGDRVLIAAASRQIDLPPAEDVPFEVVFEDPAMIVVDKPAGVVVHPAPGNERGTLVNGLLARFPELRDQERDLRPGIVHRLDKDTSGLMVVGRTLVATANLQHQMQSRTTEKRYLLLVRGNIGEDEGLIDAPIARDLRNRQRMTVRAGRSGRPDPLFGPRAIWRLDARRGTLAHGPHAPAARALHLDWPPRGGRRDLWIESATARPRAAVRACPPAAPSLAA